MVEPEDVPALAEAMVKAANRDSSERIARLSAARQAVVEDYDESVSARRLLEIYRAVLAGRHAGLAPTGADAAPSRKASEDRPRP